jgi:hypothetical protein
VLLHSDGGRRCEVGSKLHKFRKFAQGILFRLEGPSLVTIEFALIWQQAPHGFCRSLVAVDKLAFSKFFSSPGGSAVRSLWLPFIGRLPFHLPAMLNRFITRNPSLSAMVGRREGLG